MILAIAALLLHVPAVPQSTLPNISPVAPVTEVTTSRQPAGGEPASGESSAAGQPLRLLSAHKIGNRPVVVAALEPGRLTPTPVVPVMPAPAASAPARISVLQRGGSVHCSTPAVARSREQEQRRKRLWLGLSIAQSSAATFDAWTTTPRDFQRPRTRAQPNAASFRRERFSVCGNSSDARAARLSEPAHDE